MRSVPAAWRWTLLVLIVVVALAVALISHTGSDHRGAGPATAPAVDTAISAQARAAAGLSDCPRPGPAAASGPLVGITVDCLATGAPIDLAAALAGKPALLNLWAYWCAPCARELPALQQFTARAGTALTVLTVHSDPYESKALARLNDLNVHLPGVEDGDGRVRTAVGAPAVLPVSVLVRADGSIATVVVRPFDSADDIAATVASRLGLRV